MWLFFAILILLCSYIVHNERIRQETKTGYFVVVAIAGGLILLYNFIMS